MRSNSSTVYPAFASISPTVDFAVSNSKVLLPMVMYTGKTYSIFTEVVYPVLSMLMSVIDCKVKKAFLFDGKKRVKTKKTKEGVKLFFDEKPSGVDYIVELVTK